jgi:hypothetical protein
MLSALQSGDEVVTSGGIYGVITNVKDDRFVLRIAENTKIEVGKGFITLRGQEAGRRGEEVLLAPRPPRRAGGAPPWARRPAPAGPFDPLKNPNPTCSNATFGR